MSEKDEIISAAPERQAAESHAKDMKKDRKEVRGKFGWMFWIGNKTLERGKE